MEGRLAKVILLILLLPSLATAQYAVGLFGDTIETGTEQGWSNPHGWKMGTIVNYPGGNLDSLGGYFWNQDDAARTLRMAIYKTTDSSFVDSALVIVPAGDSGWFFGDAILNTKPRLGIYMLFCSETWDDSVEHEPAVVIRYSLNGGDGVRRKDNSQAWDNPKMLSFERVNLQQILLTGGYTIPFPINHIAFIDSFFSYLDFENDYEGLPDSDVVFYGTAPPLTRWTSSDNFAPDTIRVHHLVPGTEYLVAFHLILEDSIYDADTVIAKTWLDVKCRIPRTYKEPLPTTAWYRFGTPDTIPVQNADSVAHIGITGWSQGSTITSPGDVTLDSLRFLMENDGTSKTVSFALYRQSDSAFVDSTLKTTVSINGIQWVSIPVTQNATLTAVDYVILAYSSGAISIIRSRRAGFGLVRRRDATGWQPFFTPVSYVTNAHFATEAVGHIDSSTVANRPIRQVH